MATKFLLQKAPLRLAVAQKFPSRPEYVWRHWLAACCLCALVLITHTSSALDAPAIIEIGEGVEPLLDAPATRRLIALELSDVNLARVDPSKRLRSALFFRIVRVGLDVRVELWERGEFHGARVVAGANAAGQLGARRVALAAAELVRRVQKKRQIQAEHERVEGLRRDLAAAHAARRTLDGPLALRSSLEVAAIGGSSAALVGPRLLAQWTANRRARLDGGLSLLSGSVNGGARIEWLEWSLAPSARVPLTDTVDLDFGLDLAASSVRFGRVQGVDGLTDQSETWSARAALALRLEPRLSRSVRLSVGMISGLLLRPMPIEPLAQSEQRLRGSWLAVDLGLVVTPR